MTSSDQISLTRDKRPRSAPRQAGRTQNGETKLTSAEAELLRQLQNDASLSLAELSAKCGMAQSTVWRKVQEFEASGVILRRVALLDPARVGCKLSVLASVTLTENTPEAREAFAQLVMRYPEIVECAAVSGPSDYMLKIHIADMEAYDTFLCHDLLGCNLVRAVQSSFVLRRLKSTTELPIS